MSMCFNVSIMFAEIQMYCGEKNFFIIEIF